MQLLVTVGKNVHATIPKGNLGYDQYTVPDTVCFLLASLAIFSDFLEMPKSGNSELKNTHNIFRDCRVRFFQQSFSK